MPFQRRWKCIFHWHGRVWLTIWDRVKIPRYSHRLMPGRERPVNCLTVISVWWRSNMPFQRWRKWHIPMGSYGEILSGRLNYYITECTGNSSSWWQDTVEKASTQQRAGPPGLRLSNHGERERHNSDGHKSGGQYVAVLFSNSLSHTNLSNKVRGIFF